MKKEFGQTLRDLRKRQKLTQQQVADALGIAVGNISKYESGQQSPDVDRLGALARVLSVRPSELLALAEAGNTQDGPDIQGTVPLISWVQAGTWCEIVDAQQDQDAERIPTTYKPQRYTYALRVKGDSMETKFPAGCILIVEPEAEAGPGSFVIVRQNGGEATFKQLVYDGGRAYLKPLNPQYPVMEMAQDARVCGVVKRMEMDV